MRPHHTVLLALAAIAAAALPADAQIMTGTIEGRISRTLGAVPGVTVGSLVHFRWSACVNGLYC